MFGLSEAQVKELVAKLILTNKLELCMNNEPEAYAREPTRMVTATVKLYGEEILEETEFVRMD